MTSCSSRVSSQPSCPFHGAHEAMTKVCSETRKSWASNTDKLFEEPDAMVRLSESLFLSQYSGLSEGMKVWLEFFYDNVHQIKGERFANRAFKNVTVIRHKVPSNECMMMMLGCKNCDRMTEELYFASSLPDYQQDALKVLQDFFGPYYPEVQLPGFGCEVLRRRQYWQRYFQGRESREPTPPRRPIPVFSTQLSQAGLEATPIESPSSADRKPVTGKQSPRECHHKAREVQRSAIHPPSPVPSSSGSSSYASVFEEDLGRPSRGS